MSDKLNRIIVSAQYSIIQVLLLLFTVCFVDIRDVNVDQGRRSWGAGGPGPPQYFAEGAMHQSGPSNN